MSVMKRDTERRAGQEGVVAAAALYGWSEVDYRAIDVQSSERVWTKGDNVFNVRPGEAGQVLTAWAYRDAVEDRAARDRSSVVGAMVDGRNKASRTVDLIAQASR